MLATLSPSLKSEPQAIEKRPVHETFLIVMAGFAQGSIHRGPIRDIVGSCSTSADEEQQTHAITLGIAQRTGDDNVYFEVELDI